jgi:TetR/AcrR family transcriptional regulator, transcriptional repressor of bet genes
LFNQFMARTSNSDERRAQIARALLKIMAKRGYDGAAITQVAARAHLAPGLVHYHFKNKLEILLAAMRILVAEHAERLDRELARSGPDPAAQVATFLDMHLGRGDHAEPDAVVCWVQLAAEALRQRKVRTEFAAALATISDRLAAVIERGVAAQQFTCADATAAAAAVVATIHGYFALSAAAPALIPAASAIACAVRMTEGLLQCTLPPSIRRPHG